MKKVIVVGPRKTVKGGITTVLNGYKSNYVYNHSDYKIKYYSSCVTGNKLKKLLYSVWQLIVFFILFVFNRYSIVHIHVAFGASFIRKSYYASISRLFNAKIIFHIHGADWDSFYTNASRNKQQKIIHVYNKVSKLIVLSEEWKELLVKNGVKTSIEIVRNFVSINEKDIVRKATDTFNITYIGEYCDRKGCFNIPKILEKLNCNYIMNFAGFGDNEQLEKVIKTYNLSSKCINYGFVDYEHKIELLSKTDLFLFPSYKEGVPMVLLEAMSFSIPCVSTYVGGIPSIISTQLGNGVLFNPEDFNGMATQINKLYQDKKYYSEISINCKKVSSLFSIDSAVNLVLKIYDSIL